MTPHCLHPSLNTAGLNTDAENVLACSIDSFFNDLVYMMQCSRAVGRLHAWKRKWDNTVHLSGEGIVLWLSEWGSALLVIGNGTSGVSSL